MKKYTLSLFIFAFILSLFSFNVNLAKANDALDDSECEVNKTLRIGSRGSEVVCLQAWLDLVTDGKFGRKTREAVMAFQKESSLQMDGVFGPKSRVAWGLRRGIVITDVSGPQSLEVNEEGTWKITAYDKRGGTLSYSVVWGDENLGVSSAESVKNPTVVGQTVTFTHSFSQAGVYKPKFTVTSNIVCVKYPCPNKRTVSKVSSVNVGKAIPSSIAPVISGISGPQLLNVNQEGTWTVKAYDKNGGNLTYSVVWGDEGYYNSATTQNSIKTPTVQQSATFTHTYSLAGKYTPKFTVTNDMVCVKAPCPNSATTSLSVNVVDSQSNNNSLSISPNAATIKVEETTKLQARLTTGCTSVPGAACLPPPPSIVKATWTSSDSRVATVAYKNSCPPNMYCIAIAPDYLTAVVTGVGEGTATITAVYQDSLKNILTASAVVTVSGISKAPVVSYLSPSYGERGSQITLVGSGFTTTGNKIKFGDTNSEDDPNYNLSSVDGKTLVFKVPSTYYAACFHSYPACDMMTRLVTEGTYEISVINERGTSNTTSFTVKN